MRSKHFTLPPSLSLGGSLVFSILHIRRGPAFTLIFSFLHSWVFTGNGFSYYTKTGGG
jgi:hypothetical protein